MKTKNSGRRGGVERDGRRRIREWEAMKNVNYIRRGRAGATQCIWWRASDMCKRRNEMLRSDNKKGRTEEKTKR